MSSTTASAAQGGDRISEASSSRQISDSTRWQGWSATKATRTNNNNYPADVGSKMCIDACIAGEFSQVRPGATIVGQECGK